MTRKHFIEIAQNFNMDIIFHLNNDRTGTALAVYYAATHLCPCFGRSNSSFDEARFKQALIVNIKRSVGWSGLKSNESMFLDEIENMSDLSDFFCNG